MKDSVIIKILYGTVIGRIILKLLVNPWISRVTAVYLKSNISRVLIGAFIKKNHIDMSRYIVPKGGYKSFDDFFIRKMKENRIHIESGELVSPCDGLLSVCSIDENSVFDIKHTKYSLKELLNSAELAKKYQKGTAFVFRLTPSHFHRYIWATNGAFCGKKVIRGILHSVQPICHDKTKVFVQNTREYSVVKNETLGNVIQMEIGALLVGKISNYDIKKGYMVSTGKEKGYFEYGGSSIVVLVEDSIEIPQEIMKRKKAGTEIPVRIGERLLQL